MSIFTCILRILKLNFPNFPKTLKLKKQENGIHFGVEQIDLLCDMKSLDTAQKKVNGDGKKQEPAKQLKIMKNFFLNMQIRCPLMITILSI